MMLAVCMTGSASAADQGIDGDIGAVIGSAQRLAGIDTSLSIVMRPELGVAGAISVEGSVEVTVGETNDIEVGSTIGSGKLVVPDADAGSLDIDGGIAVAESKTDSLVEYAVVPFDNGNVKVHSVIKDSSAPERFDYRFPNADTIIVDDETGAAMLFAEIDGSFELVGGVDAPWSVDSEGISVATHFEARGDILTQVVEHRSGSYSYPVTADPSWWDDVTKWFGNAGSYIVNKAKSAAGWLGSNCRWIAGKAWTGIKNYGPRVGKFVVKKIGPGALVLCAVGGGWAWYRSDSTGWVRVGDTVVGCFAW
ncbi:hypothetical protein M3T53_06595 [Actinomyces sp. B33]|uniref:hypothetical protein n=1 Tax=Actinomyces sp. B33 TaxID=2942131 RepID=UPI00234176C6|nr:hypothetical protein [Actinomyces sp. B33]MDC4233378.1 hypothetical protein [Actinomyces sp. B33]